MFNLFNTANLAQRLASKTAGSELSFQARAIARWDNEGGAPKASERHNIPQNEEHRQLGSMNETDGKASLAREAAPGSNSVELRALDDLYHQSFWKGQN